MTIALCNRRSAAGRAANKQALRPRRKLAPWRSFSDGVDAKLDGGGLSSARRRVLSGADRQRECFTLVRRTTTWTLVIGAPHVFTCQSLVRPMRASRGNCRVCAGPSCPLFPPGERPFARVGLRDYVLPCLLCEPKSQLFSSPRRRRKPPGEGRNWNWNQKEPLLSR